MTCITYSENNDGNNLDFNHRHGLYVLESFFESGVVQVLSLHPDAIMISNVYVESLFES
jgi:hypothetical protein